VLIIAIVSVVMIGVMVPSVFALTTMPNDGKPEGHIPLLDDKIVIVQHNGLDIITEYEQATSEWFTENNRLKQSSSSVIYGDLVNISDDALYYVIVRGNVYEDGILLNQFRSDGFRYISTGLFSDGNYSFLGSSPYKTAIKPGESTQFALWPDQKGWDCYEVWIESYESENKFKGISDELLRNDLEIKFLKDNNGVIKGKVHNPTESNIDYSQVIISKYDQNEKLFAILGESTGKIGPGKSKNFEIPLYLKGFPIKSHGENFIYGAPANYEVSAWGFTSWGQSNVSSENHAELRKNPVQSMSASKFFPNKDTTFNINVEKIIKNKDNREVSSCLEDPNQVFPTTGYRTILPEWIKNNAGWWADDAIEEKEFLSALDYLLSNEILKINLPREKSHMELDSKTYYVTSYNSDEIKISGWFEDVNSNRITCDLWKPDEVYAVDLTITIGHTDDYNFEQNIPLNLEWEEGTYDLECTHSLKYFATLSFDIIHGESPQVDKIIKSKVPSWIKNNAGWWADGTIDDSTFLSGLEYLVQNRIIDAGRYN
jgi:hypothetical protein